MTQHEIRVIWRHGDYLLHPEIAGGGEARRTRRCRKKGDDDDSHGGAEPWRRSRVSGATCATTIDHTDRLRFDPAPLVPAAPPPAKQKPRPQRGAVSSRREQSPERAGGGDASPWRGLAGGGRREHWGVGAMREAAYCGGGGGGGAGREVSGVWGRGGKGNEGLSGCWPADQRSGEIRLRGWTASPPVWRRTLAVARMIGHLETYSRVVSI